jgi:predicted permease
MSDLRYALRNMRQRPGFAIIAILTMALGIGANTAIFTVLRGVLLKPLPYKDPARLVRVHESHPQFPNFSFAPANFLDHKKLDRSMEGMAAYIGDEAELSGDPPERVMAMSVTASFFDVLGIHPLYGRSFQDSDEVFHGPQVVILSYRLWRRRFAGDRGIVGKAIRLTDAPFTVIGIMPPDAEHIGGEYHSPAEGDTVDLWRPLQISPSDAGRRGGHWLNVVGRLGKDVTLGRALQESRLHAAQLEKQYPNTNARWTISMSPLSEAIVGESRGALILLMSAVGLVLLIACANVANLMLARAAAREHEMAVRASLGAGGLRLIRQLLTESVLLSLFGGVLGWLAAQWGVKALLALQPGGLPRLHAVQFDGMIFAYTLAISVFAGVLFGFAPALRLTHIDLNHSLKETPRSSSAKGRLRTHGTLVIAEVGLAVILLVGSGLLLRSFVRLLKTDPGFQPERVLAVSLRAPFARYREPAATVQFVERLTDRLRSLPGVRSVGAGSDIPWTGYDENSSFAVEGRPVDPSNRNNTRAHFATPGFFETIGVPLLRGRYFNSADRRDSRQVVIVNQALVSRYFSHEDPIGKRIATNDHPREEQWSTIVGVVGSLKDAPDSKEAKAATYWPHTQLAGREISFVLRVDGEPMSLLSAVRGAISSLDREIPIASASALERVAHDSFSARQFVLLLCGAFAALALILAAIGLYGVMSYSVAERRRELGIRMALGASRESIVSLVLRQGLTLTALGVLIGEAGSLALSRLLKSLLFETSATDGFSYVGVGAVVATVTLLACYLPARRASRLDPVAAMRSD